jgi:nitroreductase
VTVISRYGDRDAALGIHNETLALQLAHRSVRKFSPQPVTDEQLSALVAAAQSAATSSNLQPWRVVAVRDPERKARSATLANDQQFINEASLFLVWVADLGRARRLAERAGTPLEVRTISRPRSSVSSTPR